MNPASSHLPNDESFPSWLRAAAAAPPIDAARGIFLHPGDRVDEFEITKTLGAGGMGVVYRAHDHKLGRDVALKVLRYELASDDRAMSLLEQEARSTARLRHSNIVTLFQSGRLGGRVYLVLELLEGETLAERLQRDTPRAEQTLNWARQILAGLGHAHLMGVIHRDLKPENIFLDRDDRVRLLDFGLSGLAEAVRDRARASAIQHEVAVSRACVGTPAYMAPEQWAGHAEARSDLYAFGIVLLEMATGARAPNRHPTQPWVGTRTKGLTDRSRRASAIFAGGDTQQWSQLRQDLLASGFAKLPSPLALLIERCLDPVAENRFGSVDDLGAALEQAFSPTSVQPSTPSPTRAKRGAIVRKIVSYRAWVATGLGFAGFGLWKCSTPAIYAPPMAYWDGDQDSGDVLEDQTGQHPAVIEGALVREEGVVGSAFCFITPGYAESDAFARIRERFTLATWVRLHKPPAPAPHNPTWIDHWDHPGGARGFLLGVFGNVAVAGVSRDGLLQNGTLVFDNEELELNHWMHFAATFDGKELILYRDGIRANSHASESSFVPFRPTPDYGVRIGRSHDTHPEATFDGCFDEMAVWDHALSPPQIAELVRRGLGGQPVVDPSFANP